MQITTNIEAHFKLRAKVLFSYAHGVSAWKLVYVGTASLKYFIDIFTAPQKYADMS